MKQILADSQGLPVKFYFNEETEDTIIVLTESIEYEYNGVKYIIPAGFDSDGASIPRIAWRIIGHPFDMKYLKQAIFHDWLYRTQILPRELADKVFLTDTKEHLGWLRRNSVYMAVRSCGWVAWNKHKKTLDMKNK